MRLLLVIFSFFILLSLVPAQTPLQTPADIALQHQGHTVQKVDLMSIDPAAAKLITEQNPKLNAFKPWTLPDSGRWASEGVINQGINDTNSTIPFSLQDFRQKDVPLTQSLNPDAGKSKTNLPTLDASDLKEYFVGDIPILYGKPNSTPANNSTRPAS